MFENIYVLKINNINVLKKLVKYHIYIQQVIYKNNFCYIYVDYYNYNRLLKYKKAYQIELVTVKGINKYKYLWKKYFLFFISSMVGIIWIMVLSNIIFDVKIMTNNNDLYKIIDNELKYYGIDKYHFIKSFNEKETIKKNILNDHKDTIEWIEITRSGSKYIVNVLERVINDNNLENGIQNVIAKKNAIIVDIKGEKGSIVKKKNDYVNKGDIIISGVIKKGEDIVDYVRAEGTIYGETWYNVKVTLPINYYDKIYTGKEKKRLVINYLNKNFKLFNFSYYKKEEISSKIIVSNRILPFSLSYSTIKEIMVINDIYTHDKALEIGINLAKERLMSTLHETSKIISQKKLKLYEKDSKIVIEVFFKVYENITDYGSISVEGE